MFFSQSALRPRKFSRIGSRQGRGAIGTGLCIGSSLRFLVGMAKRAPKFYRVAGLEWLYRLMADPIGHADRVFVQSFPLIPLMLRARFRKR